MDCARPSPEWNADTKDWLQRFLAPADAVAASIVTAYPSHVQHWIGQYLAFYHLPDQSSRVGLEYRMFRLSGGDGGLVGQAWIPQDCRGTLYFVHGYLDHTGLSRHIINFALDNQFAFVGLDLPGHGLSQGRQHWVDSFEAYTDILQDLLSTTSGLVSGPAYLVGQSTGGAIVANWLFRSVDRQLSLGSQKELVRGVGLLAPLIRPTHWSWFELPFRILRFVIRATPRDFSACSHDLDFLRFQKYRDVLQGRWIPWAWVGAMAAWVKKVEVQSAVDTPMIIIQGDADKTVDFHYNLVRFQRVFPRAQVVMLDGARHNLVNESPIYRDAALLALKNHFGW